jgi:hypothetical protein
VDGGGDINMAAGMPSWRESAVAKTKLGALLHKVVELQQTFKDEKKKEEDTDHKEKKINYWKFGVMVKS